MNTATPQKFGRREYWLVRASAVDNKDKVTITYPRSRDRHSCYTKVEGAKEDVFDHVAWMIQHDSCTPMYEHMLMRVISVEETDGNATVIIYKNLYAGD